MVLLFSYASSIQICQNVNVFDSKPLQKILKQNFLSKVFQQIKICDIKLFSFSYDLIFIFLPRQAKRNDLYVKQNNSINLSSSIYPMKIIIIIQISILSMEKVTTKRRLWTEEDNSLLEEAVQKFGFKWQQVANYLQTRTPSQCSQRWKRIKKKIVIIPNISLVETKKAVDQLDKRRVQQTQEIYP
ncbi:hypothetical protein pb186bvf_007850 [Paramecium bursaria]